MSFTGRASATSLTAGATRITAVTAAAGASKHRLPSVPERQYKQHSHYDSDQIRYGIHQISFLTAPVFYLSVSICPGSSISFSFGAGRRMK